MPRHVGKLTIREREAYIEHYVRLIIAEQAGRGVLYERWGSQVTAMLQPMLDIVEQARYVFPWQAYLLLEGFFGD